MQALWPGLFARHGANLGTDFDLTTLAHITDGYTSGAMDMVSAFYFVIFSKQVL